jgi:gluconate 2-dehydrogenase gamma chain
MDSDLSRRAFLRRGCSSLSAVWVASHWPALLSAARHAREAAQSAAPKLEFFTPDQIVEIDAITSRIIPSDETPGAHEAGVAYFIDRALTTFAAGDQKTYREGLPEFAARTKEVFPSLEKFSAASHEQQDEILHSFDQDLPAQRRPFRSRSGASNFFQVLRTHTVIAFLLDPDSGGDRKGVGWKLIGRDGEHTFEPPFGYYDKDYAGWQPIPSETEKTKS